MGRGEIDGFLMKKLRQLGYLPQLPACDFIALYYIYLVITYYKCLNYFYSYSFYMYNETSYITGRASWTSKKCDSRIIHFY